MKFYSLTFALCLMMAGCSDPSDQSDIPPPPPAPSETNLGEASGSPEDMLGDSAAEDETETEDKAPGE